MREFTSENKAKNFLKPDMELSSPNSKPSLKEDNRSTVAGSCCPKAEIYNIVRIWKMLIAIFIWPIFSWIWCLLLPGKFRMLD